jgi:hypothetical protein
VKLGPFSSIELKSAPLLSSLPRFFSVMMTNITKRLQKGPQVNPQTWDGGVEHLAGNVHQTEVEENNVGLD